MEQHDNNTLAGKRLTIFGCGYVGLGVARQALKQGMQVAALTRNADTAKALRAAGLQDVVVAQLQDSTWHAQLKPDCDYLFNCVSSAGGGIAGYRLSYLEGQESILQWLRGGRAGTFIYTGATSVYPQSDGSWVDENAPHQGISDTAAILLQAEAVLARPHSSVGRWFILRLAGIYGPGRHFLLDRIRRGGGVMPGDGSAYLNLIHRDDIISAVWAAFFAPGHIRNRIYNVADGHPAIKSDICDWLAKQVGLPPPRFDPSLSSARDAARTGASGNLPNRRINVARIRAELDWEPRYKDFRLGFKTILANQPDPGSPIR